jgi:hypothetical protein
MLFDTVLAFDHVQQKEGNRISLPTVLVEIDGQEVAGLVEQHRVDASDEWLITRVSP